MGLWRENTRSGRSTIVSEESGLLIYYTRRKCENWLFVQLDRGWLFRPKGENDWLIKGEYPDPDRARLPPPPRRAHHYSFWHTPPPPPTHSFIITSVTIINTITHYTSITTVVFVWKMTQFECCWIVLLLVGFVTTTTNGALTADQRMYHNKQHQTTTNSND